MALKDPGTRRLPQFALWQLFWVMTVIAGLLALHRLGIVVAGAITFFGAESLVVVLGTMLIVNRRPSDRALNIFLRGTLGGAILATVCVGWIFLAGFVLRPDARMLAMAGIASFVGAIIGSAIAAGFLYWRARNRA